MVELTVSRGFSWIMPAAMLLGALAVQACGDDGSGDTADDGTSGSSSAGLGGSATAGRNSAGTNNRGGAGNSGGTIGSSGALGTSGSPARAGSGGSSDGSGGTPNGPISGSGGTPNGPISGSGGTPTAGGTSGAASGGTSPEPSLAGAGAGGDLGGQGGTEGDTPAPLGGAAGAGGEAGLGGDGSFDGDSGGAGGATEEPLRTLTLSGSPTQVPLAPGGENWVEATLVNPYDAPLTVSVEADGPTSMTITPDSETVDLGAGETKVIEFALSSTATSGTSEFTLFASAPRAESVTLAFTAFHSDDLARNAVNARFPSPFAKSSQPNQAARLAFDGRADTFWVSAGTMPGQGPRAGAEEELGVDFGTEVTIASVTMTPRERRGPTEYDVQLSDDGETWQTVAAVTNTHESNPVVTPIEPPRAATQLRLFIKGSRDPGHPTDDTVCPAPCDPRNVQIVALEVRTSPAATR